MIRGLLDQDQLEDRSRIVIRDTLDSRTDIGQESHCVIESHQTSGRLENRNHTFFHLGISQQHNIRSVNVRLSYCQWLGLDFTLRKHYYSNIQKISPPKTENFQIQKLRYFFIFLLKTQIVGTRQNRLGEAVLTNTTIYVSSRNKKNNVYPCKPQFYYDVQSTLSYHTANGSVQTLHNENTPIQIYRKFHLQKLKTFRYKNSDIFSYFCSKHRLWVLVRTASARRF